MSEQSSNRALAIDSCALLAFFLTGVLNPGHTLPPGAVAIGVVLGVVAGVTLISPRLVLMRLPAQVLRWAQQFLIGLLCFLGWSVIVEGIVDVNRLVILVLPGLALSLAVLRAKRLTRSKVMNPSEGDD